jgi:hypothetical protein
MRCVFDSTQGVAIETDNAQLTARLALVQWSLPVQVGSWLYDWLARA